MDKFADYEIVETISTDGVFEFYRASPPERLGIEAETVRLRLLRTQVDEAAMSRLAHHLATTSQAEAEFCIPDIEAIQAHQGLGIVCHDSQLGTLADPSPDIGRADVLRFIASAARGLESFHQLGVTHNDIRPQNIRLIDDSARIANPGILHVIHQGQVLAGTHSQIPIEYIHPDLVRGRRPDRKTDIWSLGVTLHRALTGSSIFPEAPDSSLLNTLRHMQIQGPTLGGPLLDPEQEIIAQMLGLSGAPEFSSLLELADKIEGLAVETAEPSAVAAGGTEVQNVEA